MTAVHAVTSTTSAKNLPQCLYINIKRCHPSMRASTAHLAIALNDAARGEVPELHTASLVSDQHAPAIRQHSAAHIREKPRRGCQGRSFDRLRRVRACQVHTDFRVLP